MNVYIRKNTSYYHPIIYVLKIIEKNRNVIFNIKNSSAEAEIIWDDSWQRMGAGDTKVISFSLTSPDKQGTYLYKVILEMADDDLGTNAEVYDSTTFFIKTS